MGTRTGVSNTEITAVVARPGWYHHWCGNTNIGGGGVKVFGIATGGVAAPSVTNDFGITTSSCLIVGIGYVYGIGIVQIERRVVID